MATVAVTKLRRNIYSEFEAVAKTGKGLFADYKSEILKIRRVQKPSKLAALIRQDAVTDDIDDLVHIGWKNEWRSLDARSV
ncbi:MAG: hypothetical protein JSR44_06895 [Spirochaetes bacterium]|nr:hypothetical protein [Spirochaetota bacterium]